MFVFLSIANYKNLGVQSNNVQQMQWRKQQQLLELRLLFIPSFEYFSLTDFRS